MRETERVRQRAPERRKLCDCGLDMKVHIKGFCYLNIAKQVFESQCLVFGVLPADNTKRHNVVTGAPIKLD